VHLNLPPLQVRPLQQSMVIRIQARARRCNLRLHPRNLSLPVVRQCRLDLKLLLSPEAQLHASRPSLQKPLSQPRLRCTVGAPPPPRLPPAPLQPPRPWPTCLQTWAPRLATATVTGAPTDPRPQQRQLQVVTEASMHLLSRPRMLQSSPRLPQRQHRSHPLQRLRSLVLVRPCLANNCRCNLCLRRLHT
jgi:hypothetical protein